MAESPESPRSPGGGLLELRATATKLIRGVDELFPKQHIEKALSKVEQITPRDCEDDDVELLLRRPPEWRKRKLRAECRLLQQQLQEKKASEEAFLKNMMTFFKDEDGKSIARRMQIQDLVDQYEELNKHCEQQELEAEALQACLQLMAAYAEDAKQRNTFLIETLTQLLSNQPTIIPGEHNELSRAWQECVLAAYHRLSNDFGTCTDNMLCRRNMFLDRLEDAKRENKEHALQMALLMQTTTQAREKLDGFKRRYFWDSSSESLKAPRVPKLPLADTPDLEPPSLVRKDPDHFLEDVPELSEDFSPQSSKSREKQPEQEPDCIQVPAGLHSASHEQPMQCQRHLHSLLPQAVPTQHHRMCSPPRIPVYTATAQNAQNAQNAPQIGWQFRSRPLVHGPCHGPCIAEPSTVPKMRVSVSPPRVVAAPPYVHGSHSAPSAPSAHSAQLLGASCRVPVGWCSGASIRVPSPVPEGVRAEPRWRNTVAPNVPSAPGPPKRGSCPCPLSERGQLWRMARSPRASHPPALRPATYRSELRMASPDAGRATVPTYVAPCQFSPRRPTRSPSPQRFQASTPRAVSPIIVRSPITYHVHRGSAPARASKERASRTPSPCAPVFTSGQPLRVAALPSQVGVTDSGCGSCQVPPSFIGMSWELPSGRSRPAPHPVPLHVPLQTPLPAPPVLRVPLRSPSPVDLGHTPRGRVEPSAWPPVNHVFRHFSPLSRSIQAPNRPMEPRA